MYTKSSIMLGLGETEDEIIDTMFDLKVSVILVLHYMLQLTRVSGLCKNLL
jgi:lipoate synthase